MATKLIGGTDGMHRPGTGPFPTTHAPMRGKSGKSMACHPNPGGSVKAGSSANSSMKTKRPLNGPGTA